MKKLFTILSLAGIGLLAGKLLAQDNPAPYKVLDTVRLMGNGGIDYVFADKVGAKYNADLRQYDPPGETRVVVTLIADRVRVVDMRG